MLRLSDELWERISEHSPEEHIPAGRAGHKPIPASKVFEPVLRILNTGAQWHIQPQCYPNHKTVHRRIQHWWRNEVLRDEGAQEESDYFTDATFSSAKGGGDEIGATKHSRDVKNQAFVERHGFPIQVSSYAAKHHEVTLVQPSFDFYMIEAKPVNSIGGKACDSDKLDKEIKQDGIAMIAPHKQNEFGRKRRTKTTASL